MRSSMRIPLSAVLVAWVLLVGPGSTRSTSAKDEKAPILRHKIVVTIDPESHLVDVRVRIDNVPVVGGEIRFTANAALTVTSLDKVALLSPVPAKERVSGASGHLREYVLRPAPGEGAWAKRRAASLRLRGAIKSPLRQRGDSLGGVLATTGVVSKDGVFLSGASGWIPRFGADLMTFKLTVDSPKGWRAVSQGARSAEQEDGDRWSVTWGCDQPMDEVYLIANRYQVYADETGPTRALAYLLRPDDALAKKYLDATSRYLAMYVDLIGPYPYAKFALVENFWESGFGMPSFTLLGSRVIRFPFILTSSYPHEILHNWWGNSVYVAWEEGNWCEGLTAYLADHLMKEVAGKGAEHRFGVLKKYRNFVGDGDDLSLSAFRSRHSVATQAVGYGKALMVFHMLRRRVGAPAFKRALRAFYKELRFKKASWADIESVFTRTAGESLKKFFAQWVRRTGAPSLESVVHRSADGLTLEIKQVQEGEPYDLRVPVVLTVRGKAVGRRLSLSLGKRAHKFSLAEHGDVVRVDVDPEFDLFRHLDRSEIPPSLGQVFGSPRVLFVLPSAAESSLGAAWRAFPDGWRRKGVDVSVITSDKLTALPKDRSVWVLGSRNRWRTAVAKDLDARRAKNPGRSLGESESYVCAARHPGDPALVLGWVATEHAAAIAGLVRKLPHYSSYSFVAFSGDAPTATDKGKWASGVSPLTWSLDVPAAPRGSLPLTVPLARPSK